MRIRIFCGLLACMISLFWHGCSNLNRSLIFATHTTCGVEVAAEAASQNPVRIVIGYKRSEGVLNPVYDENGILTSASTPSSRYRDEAYSVIAKISGELGGDATGAGAGISGAQWFATGKAADIVAGQPGIAGAMTGSAGVGAEAAKQAQYASKLEGYTRFIAMDILGDIYDLLCQIEEPAAKARKESLDALALRYPTTIDFLSTATNIYHPKDNEAINFIYFEDKTACTEEPFNCVIKYRNELTENIGRLDAAIHGKIVSHYRATDETVPKPIDALTRKTLGVLLEEQIAKRDQFDENLAREKAVIDAVTYFPKLLVRQ